MSTADAIQNAGNRMPKGPQKRPADVISIRSKSTIDSNSAGKKASMGSYSDIIVRVVGAMPAGLSKRMAGSAG
jgi:hypothetical protein